MAPGDELYFSIEAWDNRQPEPNRSRSETRFVRVRQTQQTPQASTEGIAINPVPEYFRSERQIIIDTEKLIAQKLELDPAEFARRSNALGVDQRLLRMRYGALLGEEFENGSAVGPEAAEDGGAPGAGAGAHEGPDHPPEAALAPGAAEGVPEELVHRHDSTESATYFPNEVRATLKAALAEMWQAELYLRTIRPETALPHEYEALRHLKALQEATRVYVERVGFEPPPLKPDETRLTGDLSEIQDQSVAAEMAPERSEPVVREALRVIRALQRKGAAAPAGAAESLQRAGQELAAQTLRGPGGSLEALRDLRTLVTEIQEHRFACTTCLTPAEAALWRLLPAAQPGPARPSTPASAAFTAYLQALEAQP
jgi:hypothetical protein